MNQVNWGFNNHQQPTATILELHRRNAILCGVTGIHVGLLFVFVIGIVLDPRTVAGDPVWLKPVKFAASIALFTATLGWLAHHLSVPDRFLRRVSIGIAAATLVEITLIGGQAARGVESHFNNTTGLDAAIYTAMGVTILVMTALVAWLLVHSWHRTLTVAPAFAWSIRCGIVLFVVGALEGGAMVALGDHAAGSGPSLPVFGWVLSGDFRMAHFLGLHALQVLPIVGYLTAVGSEQKRLKHPCRVVTLVAAGYAVILLVVFAYALVPTIN
ncbi:hypothetical protein ACNS7O_16610 (plasmid) [Haloferacaceae archaeon DSL9]